MQLKLITSFSQPNLNIDQRFFNQDKAIPSIIVNIMKQQKNNLSEHKLAQPVRRLVKKNLLNIYLSVAILFQSQFYLSSYIIVLVRNPNQLPKNKDRIAPSSYFTQITMLKREWMQIKPNFRKQVSELISKSYFS
ncbi:transmembrane protein, putative (macronuclear) [Tetrahymena thermophila SB210]|uniref:Transmembrane protein, putative n=1 Tax=Tetrahymena thermophila (strain SB210) TaxID=312017 RepID=Q241U2_TETTS|nr:transmembrane protein, putative [Tetrahymena thermophila SB210]EAS02478.2 transmembrane protein, putative [Tetrahymena thermophila SB210]|eukprot:XP_001022723.2 transmembrane protein, putative [Tetrahymena thermophila SB210]